MTRTDKSLKVGDLALARVRGKEIIIRITDVDLDCEEGYPYEAETFSGDTQGIPLRRDEVELIDTLPYIDPEGEDF